jgi:Holliday junction resolvase RusA-like endonuclease
MSYVLEIEIPVLPRSQTNNFGSHWGRSADKKKWLNLVYYAIKEAKRRPPDEPLQSATLTFTRRSSAQPDYDNLVASTKPVLDAFVRLLVIQDDSPKIIGYPTYAWEYAAPKKGGIRVRVEGRL